MSELIQITLPASAPPIRVFPTRTQWTPEDELVFIGDPPLFRPGTADTPVLISVTFRWHIKEADRLRRAWSAFYKTVRVGGPAFDDAGGEFTPGLFLKTGCTITSRGCVKDCGWCVERSHPLREISIKPGWIVQDSNLLACSEKHIRAVFEMLKAQNRRVFFNGGLDKHFLKDWHRPLLDSIPIGELWFACDRTADLPWLERASKILDGIPLRKRRCYTMIGYDDESLAESEKRIERVLELGFMPFCQLYQPDDQVKTYPVEWRKVRSRWSRPAAYMPRKTILTPHNAD
jgi:hypothetical protein